MATSASDGDSADPIRVMSFNVRYDTDADGEPAWSERKDRVASVVRFHRPTVVGLQEPLEHQYDYLRAELPGYEWIGVGRRDGDAAGEHGPIGFRADRLAVLDHDTFWLSETPDDPGSTAWDSSRPRMVTWIEFRDDADRRLYAFNTHFDHKGPRARVESARMLRERVAAVADGSPAVITGDFNSVEGSDPYERLTADDASGRRLYNAQYRSERGHYGPRTTFNRFEGDPDRKIDYVFVTDDLRVLQHGVAAGCWEEGPPSDHAPVVADVAFD